LGPAEAHAIVSSRFELLRIAREEGLRVPETREINTIADLHGLKDSATFPCILKADGTFGGRGVRVLASPDLAESAFEEMKRLFRLRTAIRRFVINRDPFFIRPWWNSVRPRIIMQSYIHGCPANCGVVCWKGRVLAGVAVEVVAAEGLTGP